MEISMESRYNFDPEEQHIARRQAALAAEIGRTYPGGVELVPLGRPSSFGVPVLGGGYWMECSAQDLAWAAVALRIQEVCSAAVIDHAWLAGHAQEPHEPWALVLEPYTSPEKVAPIAPALAEWWLDVRVLPKRQSAWNPDGCLPIVMTFQPGCGERFAIHALRWLFDHHLAPSAEVMCGFSRFGRRV
jgi:hypothetical protein